MTDEEFLKALDDKIRTNKAATEKLAKELDALTILRGTYSEGGVGKKGKKRGRVQLARPKSVTNFVRQLVRDNPHRSYSSGEATEALLKAIATGDVETTSDNPGPLVASALARLTHYGEVERFGEPGSYRFRTPQNSSIW